MSESESIDSSSPENSLRRKSIPVFDSEAINDPAWFFASLVDNLPVNVVCKDSDGKFTYVNQAFSNLMGRPAEDFVGKTDFDIASPELAQKYRSDDITVMSSGAVFREVEGVEVNGADADQQHYFEVRKSPLFDRDGNVVGIEAVFWDVTAQKEAEAAADHERFLIDALMDNVPDSIYFKDTDSRFIRVSTGLAEKFAFGDPDAVLGKTDADLFSSEHADEALNDEREIMRTRKPILNKVEKETWPDDRVTWCSTTKMALLDQAGEVAGTFGISRDITNLVLAEEALRKAKLAADKANQAKSDFMANMSHEIRTPMNAVLGITELLLDTELSSTQREYLNMVLSSAESLLSLINDILDFSKIEAGKLELDPAPFNLRDAIGDTLQVLGMRAQSKNLELSFGVDSDVPNHLFGDVGRLRQVIVNLVGNAIKFTKKGEINVDVKCQSIVDQHVNLLINVSDTGIGIPKSKLKSIFREFEQADASTTRVYGGSGLGLAIASKLVELMEGELRVESEVGQGSRFSFTAKLQIQSRNVDTETLDPVPIEGIHVLIIDGNETNRLIVHDMLSNWGMKPTAQASIEDAVAMLRQSRSKQDAFALVLADANLVSQQNTDWVKSIQTATHDELPIILLTSDLGDFQKYDRMANVFQLIKPLKQSQVFEAILCALKVENQLDDLHPRVAAERPDRPLKVLLAEDNLVNQKLALGVLAKHGHQVTVANNGEEAVETWKNGDFDLILMDIQMPKLDGFEATKQIRKLEAGTGRHTPILAMTARAMESDRQECFAAGMDDFLSKPIRINQFMTRLQQVGASLKSPVGAIAPGSDKWIASRSASSDTRRNEPVAEVVDWKQALEFTNGDEELLRSLIEVLLEDAPNLIANVEQAIGSDSPADLRLQAHTLKGSVLFLGDVELAKTACQLEELGAAGTTSSASELFRTLQSDWTRLSVALEAKKLNSTAT